MPATRHARRQGRGTSYNPLALPSLPAIPISLPSFFSSSSSQSALASSSTRKNSHADPESEKEAELKEQKDKELKEFLASLPGAGEKDAGYSADSSPFFLRRSAKSRRADDLVQRGLNSSRLLQSISSSMDLETVQIVASSCALLFDTVQTVRTNRTQTRMMLERVHQIVRALINLCGDAQRNGEGGLGVGLTPGMARAIERFTETLTTLHSLLQAQASAGLLSRTLRSAEMKGQLAECDEELQHALDVFSVKTGLLTHSALGGPRKSAKDRHEGIVAALRAKGFGVGG